MFYRIVQYLRFWWQRRTRGWDDSELWSLDYTIAKFALPRLRGFRQIMASHPCEITFKEWQHIVDEIIWFMEQVVLEGDCEMTDEENALLGFGADSDEYKAASKRAKGAALLFGEYFCALWS